MNAYRTSQSNSISQLTRTTRWVSKDNKIEIQWVHGSGYVDILQSGYDESELKVSTRISASDLLEVISTLSLAVEEINS